MSFDQGLIPLYTTEFSTNMELLLQQTDSKLRGRVREDSIQAKQPPQLTRLHL